MSQVPVPGAVSRRHWIALAIVALSGCGGGSGTTDLSGNNNASSQSGSGASTGSAGTGTGATTQAAATPGTGGTGVSAFGAISAFGSVVVNGVHYDESGAAITLNGAGASSSALRLGMVASISGNRAADGLTGVAQSINIWSIAQGVVTDVGGGGFTVMGMHIALSGSTFVDTAPSVGHAVEVWGLQADARGSQWVATRVDAASDGQSVVTGRIEGSGGDRTVNGLRLSGAERLGNGVYRLVGVWDGGELKVTAARPIDVRNDTDDGKVVEIEGVVTSPLSGNVFTLGSVTVDASAVAGSAAGLRVGQKVEVYGAWQGSALIASRIEAEDD